MNYRTVCALLADVSVVDYSILVYARSFILIIIFNSYHSGYDTVINLHKCFKLV